MIKFRPHRGSLTESMDQAIEIHSIQDLHKFLKKEWEVAPKKIDVEYTGFDTRTEWDTYLVLVTFRNHSRAMGQKAQVPVGYANGDITKLEWQKK